MRTVVVTAVIYTIVLSTLVLLGLVLLLLVLVDLCAHNASENAFTVIFKNIDQYFTEVWVGKKCTAQNARVVLYTKGRKALHSLRPCESCANPPQDSITFPNQIMTMIPAEQIKTNKVLPKLITSAI